MTDPSKASELITSRVVDDVTVITLLRGGIRDEREILKMLESLGRYVEARGRLRIVLDLGNVDYMTSAGLGQLVGLLKRCRAKSAALKLCCLRPEIRDLFEVLRLDQIFDLQPGVDEAVASLNRAYETEGSP